MAPTPPPMKSDELVNSGIELFGSAWEPKLAELLQIEVAELRCWVSGEATIPMSVRAKIIERGGEHRRSIQGSMQKAG